MMIFVVFGVGFLMWLLGVIVLGVYIDEVGCCKGLIVMLFIMVSGIILIVFVLGYVMIGLLVFVFVLIGWLL